MRRFRSVEAAAVAGLVFGGTFMLAVGILARAPEPDAPATEILRWLDDGANDNEMIVVQQLTLISVIAFLWFIGVFRRRVGDRVDQFTASVFLGSGLVLAALLAIGATLLTAPTILFGDGAREPDTDVYAGLHSAGRTVMTVYGNGLAGVFTLSSATMVRRSGVFPSWLAIVGYVIAVSLILSPFDLLEETLVFPIWIMVVSVVALIRHTQLPTPAVDG